MLQGIFEGIGSLAESIVGGIKSFIEDPLLAIQTGISNIKETITSIPGKIGDLYDLLLTLPGDIVSGIGDMLTSLFVPAEGFIQDKWTAMRSRFPFVDSVSVTVDSIVDFFKETAFDEPPKVNVHLNLANSEYNWGGEAVYIDMSWYKPYKPTVDAFLSAWLWLTFIVKIWKRLPAIISGAGSDFNLARDIYESRDYINWSFSQRRD